MTSLLENHIAPAYYEAWNDAVIDLTDEMWFPGGRHSGKSTFIAKVLTALMNAKGNEQCHAVVFRKHHVDLKGSVVAELTSALREYGLDRLWEVKGDPLRLQRKDTRQTVLFAGLDDPRKHKSKKPNFGYYKWMWFEELDEFSSWEEIQSVMISYQRGPAGAHFTTFFSYNPPRSSANWVNAEAVKRAPGRKVYKTDYRDLVEMGWIPEHVLDKIRYAKKNNLESYRHIYLGEITGTGGEIFTNIKDVTLTDEQIAEFRLKASLGFDFGITNDPTVLISSYYDHDLDYLYIFDECVLMHPYFTTIHEELKRRNLTDTEIIADTAPAGWIQNINCLGAKLRGCYKAEDWVDTGVSWMRSRAKIIIDSERCPLAWKEFSRYEYDYYSDGTPKEKLPDRDNHAIDACLRGDTLVDVSGRGLIPIKELVGSCGTLRSYDETTKTFNYTEFCNVRKTREQAEMIRIDFEDGRFVECTPDHRILTSNRGYVEAQYLTEEDDVIGEHE